MESVLGKTIVYDYKDVIFDPYSEDAKTAVGKLCFFSNSPRDAVIVANEYKVEAKILTGIKDSCFIDENGTRWDCMIVSRDELKPKYAPFKNCSQFLSAYERHGGEDLENTPGRQLSRLGGIWLRSSKNNFYTMITEVYINGAVIRQACGVTSWSEIYKNFVFPDGTPCGECTLRE